MVAFRVAHGSSLCHLEWVSIPVITLSNTKAGGTSLSVRMDSMLYFIRKDTRSPKQHVLGYLKG